LGFTEENASFTELEIESCKYHLLNVKTFSRKNDRDSVWLFTRSLCRKTWIRLRGYTTIFLPRQSNFNFRGSGWQRIRQRLSVFVTLLAHPFAYDTNISLWPLFTRMSLQYLNNSLQHVSSRLQQTYKDVPAPVLTISAALAASYLVWQTVRVKKQQPSNLPPVVPYVIPFIGHGFQMNSDPVKFIQQCKKKYGPVFQV
jgi:hypothetical protein